LQRQLEIGSYNTAHFLCHRIRFALMDMFPGDMLGGTVEADETYIGGAVRGKGRAYKKNKIPVVSLVERGGQVRSHVVDTVTGKAITQLLRDNVADTARLNTDESPVYEAAGKGFASHDTVNHRDEEYSRFDRNTGRLATTNTVEGFFGNSKRSLDGTHHHISRKHAELYFAELDHKYNTRRLTDGERTVIGIKGMEGKRLMLRTPKSGRTAVSSEGI
jgi:transposase-like protein